MPDKNSGLLNAGNKALGKLSGAQKELVALSEGTKFNTSGIDQWINAIGGANKATLSHIKLSKLADGEIAALNDRFEVHASKLARTLGVGHKDFAAEAEKLGQVSALVGMEFGKAASPLEALNARLQVTADAFRMAKVTGMETGDVTKSIETQFLKLGQSGSQTITMMQGLRNVLDGTGVSMSQGMSHINKAAESFEHLSMASGGAARSIGFAVKQQMALKEQGQYTYNSQQQAAESMGRAIEAVAASTKDLGSALFYTGGDAMEAFDYQFGEDIDPGERMQQMMGKLTGMTGGEIITKEDVQEDNSLVQRFNVQNALMKQQMGAANDQDAAKMAGLFKHGGPEAMSQIKEMQEKGEAESPQALQKEGNTHLKRIADLQAKQVSLFGPVAGKALNTTAQMSQTGVGSVIGELDQDTNKNAIAQAAGDTQGAFGAIGKLTESLDPLKKAVGLTSSKAAPFDAVNRTATLKAAGDTDNIASKMASEKDAGTEDWTARHSASAGDDPEKKELVQKALAVAATKLEAQKATKEGKVSTNPLVAQEQKSMKHLDDLKDSKLSVDQFSKANKLSAMDKQKLQTKVEVDKLKKTGLDQVNTNPIGSNQGPKTAGFEGALENKTAMDYASELSAAGTSSGMLKNILDKDEKPKPLKDITKATEKQAEQIKGAATPPSASLPSQAATPEGPKPQSESQELSAQISALKDEIAKLAASNKKQDQDIKINLELNKNLQDLVTEVHKNISHQPQGKQGKQ